MKGRPVGREVCREGKTQFQELQMHEVFNSHTMTLLLKFTESNNTKFTKYKPIQKPVPFSHSQLFEKDRHYLMIVCQDALRIVIR